MGEMASMNKVVSLSIFLGFLFFFLLFISKPRFFIKKFK